MIACGAIGDQAGVALRLYGQVQCRAMALGENGFQLLGGGTMFGRVLSGLMLLAVALIGYRLMLGERPTPRDAVSWVVRLGVVLALTGSWSAYGTLFHRTALQAPGEIAAVILPAAGLGDPAALVLRTQSTYDGLIAAARAAAEEGPTDAASTTTLSGTDPVAAPAVPTIGQEHSPRVLALTGAAIALVALGLGGWLAAQFATGLLLALGPFFVAALLLEATRGLFLGWLRALVTGGLGAMASMAVLSVELDLLGQPAGSGTPPPDAAATLAIVAACAVMLAAGWWICLRAAGRIRLPGEGRPAMVFGHDRAEVSMPAAITVAPGGAAPAAVAVAAGSATRVRAMGEAMSRRERVLEANALSVVARSGGGSSAGGSGDGATGARATPGQGQRRTAWRATASATRRDGRG